MAADAVRVAREKVRALDPIAIAEKSGARFTGTDALGEFELLFMGAPVRLTWPELCVAEGVDPLPDHVLALLLYYLALSDGTVPVDRLVSFAELPDGRFYVHAFRGYTGASLARAFAADPDALEQAVARLGGEPIDDLGDMAWRFSALPNVPVTLIWWNADDEFAARAEVMYDATASHHLTTDGCAVLGSWLTTLLRR